MGEKRTVLEADGVSVCGETDGKPILSGLNLSVREGEWLAVVGRNGSGKSTLAKALAGVCPLEKGTIRRRGEIRLLLQNPEAQMIGETVEEDICLGMENYGIPQEEWKERAYAALEQVGLSGMETAATYHLSGGQKQLVGIAGALAAGASVLIFDESTSMLDPLSREQVIRVVAGQRHWGTAIVWITQLMDELAWSDRIVVIERGTMAFDGARERFFYGRGPGSELTYCESFGFVPPFTVQVAHHLLNKGFKLPLLPVSPEELGSAAGALCRSSSIASL